MESLKKLDIGVNEASGLSITTVSNNTRKTCEAST